MMKTKIALSILVIIFVFAASLGATMAWFTDTAELSNEFTAGKLEIGVTDEWEVTKFGEAETSDIWDNANPGECQVKEFTITNKGTKQVYVRFNYVGGWIHMEHSDINNADDTLVTISPVDIDAWTFLEIEVEDEDDGGYWYYNGVIPADDENPETSDHIIEFKFAVCLDGPGTGNEYQEAIYEIEFDFFAVQATHYASFDLWKAGYYEGDTWYEVSGGLEDGFTMPLKGDAGTWDPTGAGEPNYKGWDY